VGEKWCVIPEQLLSKARLVERGCHVPAQRRIEREGQISITRAQRKVLRSMGQGMEPVQPVCPPAHDHQMPKPGSEGIDEACEGGKVLHVRPCPR